MHFKMSPAICFNLDLSKILLSANGLKLTYISEWIAVLQPGTAGMTDHTDLWLVGLEPV